MAPSLRLNGETEFGQRVQHRLAEEPTIWLTTTGRDGTPQPNPVWFVWDGESFLIYNRAGAARLKHIPSRPRVALNLDGNGQGGDIVVLTGRARIMEREPGSDRNPAYVAKYGERMRRVSGDAATFAQQYPVALRVWPDHVRGH